MLLGCADRSLIRYDNYLAPGDKQDGPSHLRTNSAVSTATSRNSGIGALGMGLLAMDSDDDDSDDDEAFERRRRAEKAKREQEKAAEKEKASQPASKNAALAAAIANPRKNGPSASSPTKPSFAPSPPASPKEGPPIAAPKPGYAAQVSALSSGLGKTPSPVQNPFEPEDQRQLSGPPQPNQQPPPMQQPPHLRGPPGPPQPPPNAQMRGPPAINMNMGAPPMVGGGPLPPPPPPGGVIRGMTPAPLAPPVTPIKPVFAVPKTTSPFEEGKEGAGGVKWDDLPAPTPRKPIMRGQGEDAILPTRGEKGDDFWRRFSMIAKVEKTQKESSWLKKARSSASAMSRWVWIVGLLLLMVIGGAIGLGMYLSQGTPDHQAPTTLGGNTSKPGVAVETKAAAKPSASVSTSTRLHVTPTHTIAGRAVEPLPVETEVVVKKKRTEHLHARKHRKSRF